VQVIDQEATLDGRTGVALGRLDTVNGTRQEIIVDPDSGQVIGEREVVPNGDTAYGIPAGGVIGWTAVTLSVVDSAPTGGTLCGHEVGCSR
jgi:hypothetical protein